MEIINFVTDLDNAYKRNRREWEALQEALASNAKEIATVQAKRVISENQRITMYSTGKIPADLTTEAQRRADMERLNAKAADLKEQLITLQDNAEKEFKTIERNMTAKLSEELAANPESVDQNGYSLITSHIVSDSDLVALSQKYRENPTMLKIVESEAANRNGDGMTALAIKIKRFLDPHDRIENFDRAVMDVTRGLNPNADFGNINNDYWNTKGLEKIREEIGGTDVLSA